MKDKIRVSMGTLRVLGLELLSTDADPTTAYLQIYEPGKCRSNCRFCAQARESSASEEKIARGLYPPRDLGEIAGRLSRAYEHGLLKRACLQTMNYSGLFDDLVFVLEKIRGSSDIPVSVSIYPFPKERFAELKALGVDKLVIPLDAATPEIFDRIKGKTAKCPYSWDSHMAALRDAVSVFGPGNVGTHLIVGLGESEQEFLSLVHDLSSQGIYSALFAFTPVQDSQLWGESPDIGSYRRLQLASYLLEQGLSSLEDMSFSGGLLTGFGLEEAELLSVIDSGLPFITRGCPECNRPFSTEKPGSVLYNFPEIPGKSDLLAIREVLGL